MEPEGSLPQFTSARQLSLSWASLILSVPPHPISWRSISVRKSVVYKILVENPKEENTC